MKYGWVLVLLVLVSDRTNISSITNRLHLYVVCDHLIIIIVVSSSKVQP